MSESKHTLGEAGEVLDYCVRVTGYMNTLADDIESLSRDRASTCREIAEQLDIRRICAMREIRQKDATRMMRPIVEELRETMQCNCDLDRWEPERMTGHSFVCRIHKAAIAKAKPSPGE